MNRVAAGAGIALGNMDVFENPRQLLYLIGLWLVSPKVQEDSTITVDDRYIGQTRGEIEPASELSIPIHQDRRGIALTELLGDDRPQKTGNAS